MKKHIGGLFQKGFRILLSMLMIMNCFQLSIKASDEEEQDMVARATNSFHVVADFVAGLASNAPGSKHIDVFRINGYNDNTQAGWDNYSLVLRWKRDEPGQQYAYCLEVGKGSQPDDNYMGDNTKWQASKEYSALAYIFAYAAKKVGDSNSLPYSSGTWWVDYAIAQMAAHRVVDTYDAGFASQHDIDQNSIRVTDVPTYLAPNNTQTVTGKNDQILSKMNQLYNDAVNFAESGRADTGFLDKVALSVTPDSSDMRLENGNYIVDFTINPQVTGGVSGYESTFASNSSLELTSANGGEIPNGYSLVKTSENHFRLTVPKGSLSAGNHKFSVKAKGTFNRSMVLNYISSNPSNQSMGFWEKTTSDVSDAAQISVAVEELEFGVKKVWKNDTAANRPDGINVELHRGLTLYDQALVPYSYKTLTAANNWQLPDNDRWEHLPKYDGNGKEYIYTVVETNCPTWYTSANSFDTATNDFIITNTLKTIELGVKKVWKNDTATDRPDDINVELHRGLTLYDQALVPYSYKTLTATNNWQLPDNDRWENLPKYDGDGKEYIYTVVETGFPERYTSSNYLDSTTNDFIITNTLKNKGSLTVKKTDMSSTLLSGATFKLTKGTTSGSIVSGTLTGTGTINYTNLDDGTYYLTETASPSGYLLPLGNVKFVVSNGKTTMSNNGYSTIGSFNGTSFTYTLKNEPKEAELKVKKTDTSGSALSGATFELRKNSSYGTLISSTSGGTGILTYSKLTEGTYYLTETAAPSGYIRPSGNAVFKVTDGKITMTSNSYGNLGNFDSGTFTFTMKNNRLINTTVQVKKTNSATGNALSGVEFTLLESSIAGPIIKSVTTNYSGVAAFTFDSSMVGKTYAIQETSTPSGYENNTDYCMFTIKTDGTITDPIKFNGGTFTGGTNLYTFTHKNVPEIEKPDLTVKKTDMSGNAISGATFKLTRGTITGSEVSETSAGTGIIKYSNLDDGTYYLTETAAPSGYIRPSGNAVFKVTDGKITMTSNSYGNLGNFDSGTFTFTMKNNRLINITVQVKKTNSATGNALSGVEFTLLESSIAGPTIKSVTTNYSGVAAFTFDSSMVGKTYAIQETSTPSGYENNTDYCMFTIKTDGTITDPIKFNGGTFTGGTNLYTFTHKNVPEIEKPDLTVKKTDMSGNAISGATFKLTRGTITGSEVSETSAGTGIIKYSNLDDGTYYLTETAAPSGYKLPLGHVEFKVLSANISMVNNDYGSLSNFNENTFTYTLKNEKETYVLPDTGGPGTTGFISGGLIMVSMAVLMLINKKRKMRRIK